MSSKERFEAFRAMEQIKNEKELLDFFDSLPPVRVEDILSKWKGGDFKTGHWGNQSLADMKWFGKWFKSKLESYPLVCYGEDGRLFSNNVMKGESSLWELEFRGKVSTTMIYDGVPIFDHFRKVDENTLFGIMTGKHVEGYPDIIDNGKYYFFYLERIAEFPAEFSNRKVA